jgi:hypothetical protein
MGKPFIDLTGQTFNSWTVTGPSKSVPRASGKGSARTHWFCTCKCGNTAWVDSTNLRQGISTNCGCLRKVVAGKGSPAAIASAKAHTTHGMSKTKVYTQWNSMRDRCYNSASPVFKYYGGRGITVCKEWHKFETFRDWAFTNGYNEKLSLDRTDNNGNYEPLNCAYKTRTDQNRNTRRNIMLSPTLTVSAFCEAHRVPYDLVWHTLKLKLEHSQVFDLLLDLLNK